MLWNLKPEKLKPEWYGNLAREPFRPQIFGAGKVRAGTSGNPTSNHESSSKYLLNLSMSPISKIALDKSSEKNFAAGVQLVTLVNTGCVKW